MKCLKFVRCTIAIIGICVLTACSDKYVEQIKQVVTELVYDGLENYDYVVVIPEVGCTGCITTVEQYFLENVDNLRYKFIFTECLSIKGLKYRLGGDENLKRTNVFIDEYDLIFAPEYEDKIYPHILTVKNGEITTVKVF